MKYSNQIRLAAAVMIVGIGLGAMGAHALEATLVANGYVAEWKTAALYQMVHGLAMFIVAVVGHREKPAFCFWCWTIGVVLFSGSLFILSYTGSTAKPIVLSTPLGGLSLMIGWVALLANPNQVTVSK